MTDTCKLREAPPRLELPDLEVAKALLARQPEFQSALLDQLWDMAEVLPWNLLAFLRDWTAHAYFEASPLAQTRIAAAHQKVES